MQFFRIITFSLLLLCVKAAGQELKIVPDLRFENFNDERNFTSGYMGNVAVDNKGYLWTAGNGLFRFDGVRLQHFTNFNNQYHGLKANYSDDLVTDKTGRLWIGNVAGLCFYNDTLEKFQYIDLAPGHPITYAFSLLISGNEMWFVCNFGLCRINLETFRVQQTALKELPDPITSFSIGNSHVAISTRTGLYLYDMMNNTFRKKILTEGNKIIRIRQCVFRNGIYWVATNLGLRQLKKTGDYIYPVSGTEQLNIADLAFHPADKRSEYLWLATINNGLQVFSIHENRIVNIYRHDEANPNSLQNNNITGLHFDKMEKLWLSTENGVSMFDYRNQSFNNRKVIFSEGVTTDNEIREAVQDRWQKDSVWLSCNNQGLLLVSWRDKHIIKQFKNFPPDLSLSFNDIHQIEDGNWLIIGKTKLIVWHPVRGLLQSTVEFPVNNDLPVNLELRMIIPVSKDIFYIAASTGLYKYSIPGNTIELVLKRTGSNIYSSYDYLAGVYDNKGIIWLASRKGLVKFNPVQHAEQVFNIPSADTNTGNYLNHVTLAGKDMVICSGNTGISLFNASTEVFSMITEFGHLRNPTSMAAYAIDSIAWINSNAGLLCINLISGKTESTDPRQKTSMYSPIPFSRVNDELVIGNRNLYSYFNPLLRSRPVVPSNPVIERIVSNNRPFFKLGGHKEQHQFTHQQNSFSFYFTAFEFNNPEQIRFRYKMEGHDKEWSYQDEQRSATFIRLPPGKYKFIVQAGNNLDEWNENAAEFNMYIVPPLWQRWWFWPGIALLFVTTVIILARKRINVIRKREEEKTEMNKSLAGLETKLLRSQMNPHFIFNSLNSIQKYIWENNEEDAAEYLSKFAKLIRAILENSRKETIPLSEELEVMKLYVELEHRRSNGRFEYFIKTSEALDTENILVPPMLLQPFIENAIWHGLNKKTAKGSLFISVSRIDDSLECTIDDDGVGRSAAAKNSPTTGKQSLGIEITRHRVRLLHQSSNQTADIHIIDKEENGTATGTTVSVTIPIQYRSNA